MAFKWKTAAKDIALFTTIFAPFTLFGALLLLISGPEACCRAYQNIRIHWGIWPCTDGHDWEYVETKRDIISCERLTEDGLEYEVHDTEMYECSYCWHTKNEYINERPKQIDAHEL